MRNSPLSAEPEASPGSTELRDLAQFDDLSPELEPAAAPVLALAFRDNPINRAVIQANRARRLVVNTHGMITSLVASRRLSFRRVAREPSSGGFESPEGGVVGGLVALDPGGYPARMPPLTVQLRCLWGQGYRVMHRWGQLYRELDGRHPREPHCYLSLLAVHPARQRRGIGRALLETWLADVDALRMPSYLETDRKELVGFYQSAGFEVAHELEVFGASIWCMSRPARVR